jgi:hypothetical protein
MCSYVVQAIHKTLAQGVLVLTFSNRLMISVFGFALETAGAEDTATAGESLNKSSIPDVDGALFSTGLAVSNFTELGAGSAAEKS